MFHGSGGQEQVGNRNWMVELGSIWFMMSLFSLFPPFFAGSASGAAMDKESSLSLLYAAISVSEAEGYVTPPDRLHASI